MTKIVVCGDSWQTRDLRAPGKHYSEILENKYGSEVISLGRAGMSTIGICFQLNEAVGMQPAAIVCSPSGSNRTEIAVGKYNIQDGLCNIRYTDKMSASCASELVGGTTAPIVSDVFNVLLEDTDWTILSTTDNKYNLSIEQREAVKQYFIHLFDPDFKVQVDSWAYEYWILYAQKFGITIVQGSEFSSDILAEIYAVSTPTSPWVFHTDFETQERFADALYQQLLKKNITP